MRSTLLLLAAPAAPKPLDGDRIYNGAVDNGSGSARLLDVAALSEPDLGDRAAAIARSLGGQADLRSGAAAEHLHP